MNNFIIYLCIFLSYIDSDIAERPLFILPDSYDMKALAIDEEHIVLLARSEPHIRIFNHSGQLIRSWGYNGQGPQEFTSVQGLALSGQTIWVLNKLPGKIISFSISGQYIGTQVLNTMVFPQNIGVVASKVYIQEGGQRLPQNQLYLLENEKLTMVTTIDMGEFIDLKSGGIGCRVSRPFAPKDYWALSSNGALILSKSGKASMRFCKPDGSLDFEWHVEQTKYRVPAAAIDIWLEDKFPDVKNGMGLPTSQWRKEAKSCSLPDYYPPVMALLVDSKQFWILRAFRGDQQHWQCYNEGKLARALTLPTKLKVCQIISSRVYAVDTSHVDEPVVVYTFK